MSRIKIKAFMLFFFTMTFVTKTIQEPIFINISPADVLWPFMAIIFIYILYKTPDLLKMLYADKNIWIFGLLFLLGIIVSFNGYVALQPLQLSPREYGKSLLISNVKNLLILGYFLSGWLLSKILSEKTFAIFGVFIVTVFSGIGIFAKVTGQPSWVISGNRLLSTVNDPNVAGLICLIGLLFCWKIFYLDFNKNWKKITILFIGGIGSVVGIFLTGSRTSLMGLILMCLFFIIDNCKRWKVLILILSLIFFSLSGLYNLDNIHFGGENYRYLSARFFSGTEGAYDFRSDLREAALMMGKDHYMMGVGSGQFPIFSAPYYESLGYDVTTDYFKNTVSPKVPHNTYATYFAERGILGLGLFLGLLVYSLLTANSSISRAFSVIVMTYAFFFNVENIRILWLIWGGRTLIDVQADRVLFKSQDVENSKVGSWIKVSSLKWSLGLILIFFLSCGIMIKTLRHMYRPYQPLVNESTEIYVGQDGLDLMLEFSGGSKDLLFIKFEGKKTYDYIIRNSYGFYKDTFDLPQGTYNMTLSTGSGQKKFILGAYKTGNQSYVLYNSFLNGELMKRPVACGDDARLMRTEIPLNVKRKFENVEYQKSGSLFTKQEIGINFEDKIQLSTIMLKTLENVNQYEMVFEFKKIGEIDKPFMLLARGYDMRDFRRGWSKNIPKNITFEPDLTKLEIGQTFTGTWVFNTEDRPYMLQYSFYYKDPETGKGTQLYPKWVLDGYVQ